MNFIVSINYSDYRDGGRNKLYYSNDKDKVFKFIINKIKEEFAVKESDEKFIKSLLEDNEDYTDFKDFYSDFVEKDVVDEKLFTVLTDLDFYVYVYSIKMDISNYYSVEFRNEDDFIVMPSNPKDIFFNSYDFTIKDIEFLLEYNKEKKYTVNDILSWGYHIFKVPDYHVKKRAIMVLNKLN